MNTLPKTLTGLIISGVIASSLVVAPAFAKGGDDGKRGPNIERIAEKLELSEAQTVSFTEIMQAQGEKREAMREEMKTQREALRAETLASLETVLSEEQLTEMKKMMERGKKKHGGKKGDR